jgi:hypothetical protein
LYLASIVDKHRWVKFVILAESQGGGAPARVIIADSHLTGFHFDHSTIDSNPGWGLLDASLSRHDTLYQARLALLLENLKLYSNILEKFT